MSNILNKQVSKVTSTAAAAKPKNQKIERFQKFEIYGDATRINSTFDKYGHITMPLAVKKMNGEGFEVSESGYNLWVTDNSFRKLLPNKYVFYPHEEVEHVLKSTLEKELSGTGLKEHSVKTAHQGETKYWNLITDEKYDIDGNGDNVSVGVSVRNGIGTSVALGVDLFTVRWACSNGAIAKGKNLGSMSIAHVTNAEKMGRSFLSGITTAFQNVSEIIKVYEKSTQIKVNTKIANQMYKKLVYAGKYLPSYWELKPRKEIDAVLASKKFQETDNMVKVHEEKTLWETFNDITQQQRDGLRYNKVSFPLVALHQSKLHQAMIQVVNTHSVKGRS